MAVSFGEFLQKASDVLVLARRRVRDMGFRYARTYFMVTAGKFYVETANQYLWPRVECPCCGWRGWKFEYLNCGTFFVSNVACPQCHGHERHRMMHLFLTRRPPAFMSTQEPGVHRVLHFAPERQVEAFIKQNPRLTYVACDYDMRQYALRPGFGTDIHALPIPDNTMDGLFCIHVLEHVRDDRAALAELHRILRPGGEAVIMVPFMMHQTETEEYGAPDPEIFDHVRGYSPLDFKHRLKDFAYEEILPRNLLTAKEIRRYRVPTSQAIYLCRKAD